MATQYITVSAIRPSAAILTGQLAVETLEMILDSGSAVSLVMNKKMTTSTVKCSST